MIRIYTDIIAASSLKGSDQMRKSPMVVLMQGIFVCMLLTGFVLPVSPKMPLPPAEYFVDDILSPEGDCSQANPCYLATALAKSDPALNIYLAAGTYYGTGNEVILDTDDKPISLYGGWDRTLIYPPVRNPATQVSIIDGQDLRRGIKIWSDSVNPFSPVITGLTITNGNASGLTTNCAGPSATPSGCGGGLFIYNSSPIITGNRIYNNIASKSGGANKSGYGGGIYGNEIDSGVISGNHIYQNKADDTNQGMGGGIMLAFTDSTTEFDHNLVYSNSSGPFALHTWGGGLALFHTDSHVFTNEFTTNGAVGSTDIEGGAIFLWYGSPTITDNLVKENYGQSAVLLGYGTGTDFLRNRLIDNSTTFGIAVGSTVRSATACSSSDYNNIINNFISKADYYGMALYGNNPDGLCARIYHNTIDDAETGIYLTGEFTVSMVNNIVSNHALTGIELDSGALSSPSLVYTLFYNNAGGNGFEGTNYRNGDPGYINPAVGDYHIQCPSSAYNAGLNGYATDDIDGGVRPLYGTADVGADECTPSWLFSLPLVIRP
jgi:hypothetical protein